EIDILHRRVLSRGRETHVRARCWEVLRLLAERAGKVLTHQEILSAVWGASHAGKIEYVRLAVRELRRNLELDPSHPLHILTEARVGYRLQVAPATRRRARSVSSQPKGKLGAQRRA